MKSKRKAGKLNAKMKIIHFTTGKKPEYGILEEKVVQAVAGNPYDGFKPTERYYNIDDVRLLAPCSPSKVVAVGLNYYSHARELTMPVPNNPLLFMKPSTSVIGPEGKIVYPRASKRVDYEGELAVVMKSIAHQVPAAKALEYVLGYTCFNDVTARDLQKQDGQWTRAKGFDTFAAVGPCIETEVDPGNICIETYLNGQSKQRGSTRDLIFSVPDLVSFISGIMTLLPGDVIATGTPSGIGPMSPGDVVEIRIAEIGILRNYVVESVD
ncbi:MAG: fumarylacetoacetate hydrolase family protein [Dehalococcoidales bacterium]|nr:fumarylacetoacetate hydrolase family protein [Dehalococcoidales bacterium]